MSQRSTAIVAVDYRDQELAGLPYYFQLTAFCARCHRRSRLPLRRMILRSDVGATLGGLRARLLCQCGSRRTRLEVSSPGRD